MAGLAAKVLRFEGGGSYDVRRTEVGGELRSAPHTPFLIISSTPIILNKYILNPRAL
jgi:hypothetical protein